MYDGDRFRSAAQRGVPAAFAEFREMHPPLPSPGGGLARILETKRPDHVLDVKASDLYSVGSTNTRAMVDLGGVRTSLSVPLLKDAEVCGYISIYLQEVRAFSDKQIALLESFAAQAVIAIENARLLDELRGKTEALAQRNSEYGERIEQQDATIEVLKSMSASPGNAQPIFDLIVEILNTAAGQPFSWLDACVEMGVSVAHNEEATNATIAAVKEFLVATLRP